MPIVTGSAVCPGNEAGDNWEHLPCVAGRLSLGSRPLLRCTSTVFESLSLLPNANDAFAAQ